MNRILDKKEIMILSTIMFTGLTVALLFCFAIYPRIQDTYHIVLDPDGYGLLGINLWKGYGLTYNPEVSPTVYRGPLYPGFIALVLKLSSGWYPSGIWVAQSLFHGIVCLLVYLIAKRCWDRSTALLTGFGCAFYPVLFWYTPRMWNESLLMFLVTCLIYISVIFIEKSTMPKAIGIGIFLGPLCLGKASFLPLIVVLPLCFYIISQRKKLSFILLMIFVSVLLITPWAVRNYMLVGRVIPVHTGAGFNMKIGNAFAKDFLINPFSYDQIWERNILQIKSLTEGITSSEPLRDVLKEDIYMTSALADLQSQPNLLVKKILEAGLMFWYIGENLEKTFILLILRLPILVLASLGIYRVIRCKEIRLWPAIVIILTYWISHLPFAPPSRLSVPIMPIMFAFAMSNWYWFRQRQISLP